MQARALVVLGLLGLVGCAPASRTEPVPMTLGAAAAVAVPVQVQVRTVARRAPVLPAADPELGAIRGRIRDAATGEALVGTVITASSPGLEAIEAIEVITDDNGDYEILDLPARDYIVTFYYLQHTVERSVVVGAAKTTPVFQTINTAISTGRTFEAALGAAADTQSEGSEESEESEESVEDTEDTGGLDIENVHVIR
jgi:hypothetical protein